jgi:hypothetical protein
MDIDNLINQLRQSDLPDIDVFDGLLASSMLSRSEFCDAISMEIAKRYLDYRINWEIGDHAMNLLFQWMPMEKFPGLTWDVYLAFDGGEYLPKGRMPAVVGDAYTRPEIELLMQVY